MRNFLIALVTTWTLFISSAEAGLDLYSRGVDSDTVVDNRYASELSVIASGEDGPSLSIASIIDTLGNGVTGFAINAVKVVMHEPLYTTAEPQSLGPIGMLVFSPESGTHLYAEDVYNAAMVAAAHGENANFSYLRAILMKAGTARPARMSEGEYQKQFAADAVSAAIKGMGTISHSESKADASHNLDARLRLVDYYLSEYPSVANQNTNELTSLLSLAASQPEPASSKFVAKLVSHHVDLNGWQDKRGYLIEESSPLQIALKNHDQKVVDLLRKAGAKEKMEHLPIDPANISSLPPGMDSAAIVAINSAELKAKGKDYILTPMHALLDSDLPPQVSELAVQKMLSGNIGIPNAKFTEGPVTAEKEVSDRMPFRDEIDSRGVTPLALAIHKGNLAAARDIANYMVAHRADHPEYKLLVTPNLLNDLVENEVSDSDPNTVRGESKSPADKNLSALKTILSLMDDADLNTVKHSSRIHTATEMEDEISSITSQASVFNDRRDRLNAIKALFVERASKINAPKTLQEEDGDTRASLSFSSRVASAISAAGPAGNPSGKAFDSATGKSYGSSNSGNSGIQSSDLSAGTAL
jgi:hypothetical protein